MDFPALHDPTTIAYAIYPHIFKVTFTKNNKIKPQMKLNYNRVNIGTFLWKPSPQNATAACTCSPPRRTNSKKYSSAPQFK